MRLIYSWVFGASCIIGQRLRVHVLFWRSRTLQTSLSSNKPAAACPVRPASSARKGQEQGLDLAAVARSPDPGSPRSLRVSSPLAGLRAMDRVMERTVLRGMRELVPQ